jgi:hypothetical protein
MQTNPLTSPRYEPHVWHYLTSREEVFRHLLLAHNWRPNAEVASELLAVHRELHELVSLERGGATST